jgi:hypothetical protein
MLCIQKLSNKVKKDQVRRVEWNVLDWNIPAIDFMKNQGQST